MTKNNNAQTAPTNADADEQQDEDTTINPWTENFVQIAQYLVRDYRDKVKVAPEFPLFQKPIKLLKMLQDERKYKIINTETSGIYYIIKDGFIPEKILLVVSSELPDDESDQSLAWLRSLRNNLTAEEVADAVKRVCGDESLRSVAEFILSVNPNILTEVKTMVEDPRVTEFWNYVAVKTGAAEQAAEERAREMAKAMLIDEEPIEKIIKYTRLDRADVVVMASTIASAQA